MLRPERLFPDRQRAFVERLGFGVAALDLVKPSAKPGASHKPSPNKPTTSHLALMKALAMLSTSPLPQRDNSLRQDF